MTATEKPSQLALAINHHLRMLRYAVDDDAAMLAMYDFASLIRRAESTCDDAPDWHLDGPIAEIERHLGLAFVNLHVWIDRVANEALGLCEALTRQGVNLRKVDKQSLLALSGPYRGNASSLVQLVCDAANHFKHEQGRVRSPGRSAKKAGIHAIVQSSSSNGDLREIYEFFDLGQYSNCGQLADEVQKWAEAVYAHIENAIKVSLGTRYEELQEELRAQYGRRRKPAA
jgi:hypothetical protein